jgi:hypothetical protein
MAIFEYRMTVKEFLTQWRGWEEAGRDIGIPGDHVRVMALRQSIPVKYWPKLIASAKRRRIRGVNAKLLMELHSGGTNG